jgi:PleD family two-component response regulator
MGDRNDKPLILVVDDNYGNRLSLESLLSPDYAVDLAATGHQALALSLKQEYAVILLDVRMPVMDGFETASLLLKNRKTQDTAIIFTSAFDQGEAQVARGYEIGATDYLFSPIDPDFLRMKLRTYVRMHQRIVSLRRDIDQMGFLVEDMEAAVARGSNVEHSLKVRIRELEQCIEDMRRDLTASR